MDSIYDVALSSSSSSPEVTPGCGQYVQSINSINQNVRVDSNSEGSNLGPITGGVIGGVLLLLMVLLLWEYFSVSPVLSMSNPAAIQDDRRSENDKHIYDN